LATDNGTNGHPTSHDTNETNDRAQGQIQRKASIHRSEIKQNDLAAPQDRLDEARPTREAAAVLLQFSAYSAASLDAQIKALTDHVRDGKVNLQDLAYTLGSRREHRPYRAYAVTSDLSDIRCSSTNVVQERAAPKVAWVFTGQGAQWPGMGAELIEVNNVFRTTIRKLDAYLQSLPSPPSWSIEGT
jgi:acyl transferase domain-containing protein